MPSQNEAVQFGEYRLLRRIAQGGMAEIFLAQNKKGQVFALKRILPHLAHEEGFIRMFIDEARIVGHLDHGNIARVIDQGKHDGYYFILMEYVEGHSLLALADRARSMKIPLPRGLLAWIIAELLAALAAAHAARDSKGRHLEIVHRDVTPQNVLIAYDGTVKLIDFGVAKARARLTHTEAGFTKGKLSYMSPEQARGEELDGRSDLFSVGIVLYEITTGTRLFNKEGPGGILSAIVNDPIPLPSGKDKSYHKELETIVMRALDKEVNRRWQSADEMRDALIRFARKEKPAPGKARLADLVHDLFGEPEHRKLIESAQAVIEVTPAGPVKAEMARGASVRIRGKKMPSFDDEEEEAQKPPDDTRMMAVEESRQVKNKSRASVVVPSRPLAATNESIPALSLQLQQDDVPVPEPKIPGRVKFARLLAQIAEDARESFLAHKKKYILGLTAFGLAGLVVILAITGVFGAAGEWLGGAAEKAREIKKSAGLDPSIADAGVLPTVLRLSSEPPGASVTVDGMGAGCTTPCDLTELPLGKKIALELNLSGYRAHIEKLTLWPNTGLKAMTVSLERQVAALTVESEPAGATVFKDGAKLIGGTPLTVDGVRAGQPIKIDVSKPGYIGKSRVVLLQDGEMKVEHFDLVIDQGQIPPGKIDVKTDPPGCAVMVDEQPAGRSPMTGYSARQGVHTVKVKCDNYEGEERAVVVQPSKTSSERFELTPNVFGFLSIAVVPPEGAQATVNGRKVNLPIEFLKVIPGHHVVEVKNERLGGKSKRIELDVRPEERVSRQVSLY